MHHENLHALNRDWRGGGGGGYILEIIAAHVGDFFWSCHILMPQKLLLYFRGIHTAFRLKRILINFVRKSVNIYTYLYYVDAILYLEET